MQNEAEYYHTFPLNCERVLTNSVGYVMNLKTWIMSALSLFLHLRYGNVYASTAPAVVPAIRECSGFSFRDIVKVFKRVSNACGEPVQEWGISTPVQSKECVCFFALQLTGVCNCKISGCVFETHAPYISFAPTPPSLLCLLRFQQSILPKTNHDECAPSPEPFRRWARQVRGRVQGGGVQADMCSGPRDWIG